MPKASITALRDWLKTCPLIAEEQDATGAAFRIAGLEEEATAFSIEDSPTDPIVESYISGRDLAKNYTLPVPKGVQGRPMCSPLRTAASLNSWPTG